MWLSMESPLFLGGWEITTTISLSLGGSLYSTPCGAHCLNLMLKGIGKLKKLVFLTEKCKVVTKFTYNHSYIHSLVKNHCSREMVREATTRFTTAFLTMQFILEQKAGLKSIVLYRSGKQTERQGVLKGS
ncbi:hypothetical protein AMTRI_Chr13g121210 [Amborella trichopoda]